LFWRLLNSNASLIAIALVVSVYIVREAAVLPLAIPIHEPAANACRLESTITLITLSSIPTSSTAASTSSAAKATSSSIHGRCWSRSTMWMSAQDCQ
jgi:hypothetical protein